MIEQRYDKGSVSNVISAYSPGLQTTVENQVAAGDTLAAIATHFGSTIVSIVQENNLESPDQIREGQTKRDPHHMLREILC